MTNIKFILVWFPQVSPNRRGTLNTTQTFRVNQNTQEIIFRNYDKVQEISTGMYSLPKLIR